MNFKNDKLHLGCAIVREIQLDPLAGAEINELKNCAKLLAYTHSCRVLFYHNADTYIADEDGNCVKASMPMDKIEGIIRRNT